MFRLMRFGIVALVFPVLVFTACTKSNRLQSNILHRGNGAEPKDIDPHIVTGVPEHHIIVSLFEGLVSVDPKTVEPIEGVAKLPPKISKSGKVYTFTLRKEAKWSNGDPVTAHDFVYAWRRILNPATGSQYSDMLYPVKNAEKINKGQLKDATKLGAKAIDDHTLEVTLEAPTPYFLGLLYHYTTYPVHKATIEKHGPRWTRPENFVGNGAFVLEDWVLNKVIKVKKSPTYWDRDSVSLDGVHFHAIEDNSSEEKQFRAGKLHVTNEVPIEKVPFWQKDKSGVFVQTPYLGTYFYRFNTRRKPLNDKRVRKALALAIDRERIVNYVTKGGQMPATAFTPPGTAGFYPSKYLPSDGSGLEKAKKLLAEAGYPGGKGMRKLQILYNTTEGHKKIAEAIQQMWKKNLGIDVELFNQEWKVYLANETKGNFDISRAGWIGDYNDPNTFLDMFVTGRGNNKTGWGNKKFDALIKKAANELNLKKRLEYFQEAEGVLMEDVPVFPIYTYTRLFLKQKMVKGWFPNISDYHPLKFVTLEQGSKS